MEYLANLIFKAFTMLAIIFGMLYKPSPIIEESKYKSWAHVSNEVMTVNISQYGCKLHDIHLHKCVNFNQTPKVLLENKHKNINHFLTVNYMYHDVSHTHKWEVEKQLDGVIHLKSTLFGMPIKRIISLSGYKIVISDSYINDKTTRQNLYKQLLHCYVPRVDKVFTQSDGKWNTDPIATENQTNVNQIISNLQSSIRVPVKNGLSGFFTDKCAIIVPTNQDRSEYSKYEQTKSGIMHFSQVSFVNGGKSTKVIYLGPITDDFIALNQGKFNLNQVLFSGLFGFIKRGLYIVVNQFFTHIGTSLQSFIIFAVFISMLSLPLLLYGVYQKVKTNGFVRDLLNQSGDNYSEFKNQFFQASTPNTSFTTRTSLSVLDFFFTNAIPLWLMPTVLSVCAKLSGISFIWLRDISQIETPIMSFGFFDVNPFGFIVTYLIYTLMLSGVIEKFTSSSTTKAILLGVIYWALVKRQTIAYLLYLATHLLCQSLLKDLCLWFIL